MAKQSGIHQLRGKVGEHSYYRQTGINAGLMRSINQGLSSRVKNGEEFANTRLNNAEFGGAANVAGLLGGLVIPKFRPMILPFSQSNMAKKVLEIVKGKEGAWGHRVVTAGDTELLCEILTSQSKRKLDEFVSLSINDGGNTEFNFACSYSADQATLMSSLGISGFVIRAVVYNLATGKYQDPVSGIRKGYSFVNTVALSSDQEVVAGVEGTLDNDFDVTAWTPEVKAYNAHQIIVAILMPFRLVDNVQHTLQEYCSFKAMIVPQE